MNASLRRTVRAQIRDARVLLNESRVALLLFAATVLVGGLALHLAYTVPDTGRRPGIAEALHASFALIFFESMLPFPHQWYLQILFFAIPILGLAAVADGVLRFGSALVDK